MSRRIFRDVEEALAREVRRITFHDERTASTDVLQELFDPFTGEVITDRPVQPSFYDSSADASNILYPHVFVKLAKTREDRFTGRVEPPYGQYNVCYSKVAPKAYQIIYMEYDGQIAGPTSEMTTNTFKLAQVQPGFYLRIITGNNIGTYIVDHIDPSKIIVSNILVDNLPAFLYDPATRTVIFTTTDISTVKVGDILVDNSSSSWTITTISPDSNSVIIDGSGSPDLTAGASITRSGNVFTGVDTAPVKYLILDPSKPITVNGKQVTVSGIGKSPQIPIDAYYLVRIDSKERVTHIDILNRMWEEFNPPRTALPVIVRSKDSAESVLDAAITSGGSTTITVKDNSKFKIGDPAFIFDDVSPSKSDYGFQQPFKTTVVGKVSTNQLLLADLVPDTYTVQNCTKIVTNASFQLLMFHFVNHDTRDNEGAQYWVHEFTFWVQVWVDRLETPAEFDNPILDISTPIEDEDGNIIFQDI